MTSGLPELLRGVAESDAAAILSLGSRVHLQSGAVLFSLGDDADTLFLVERGRVALTLPLQVGGRDEDVLVEERQPGQTVGWSALIPPHRFTLKATARWRPNCSASRGRRCSTTSRPVPRRATR